MIATGELYHLAKLTMMSGRGRGRCCRDAYILPPRLCHVSESTIVGADFAHAPHAVIVPSLGLLRNDLHVVAQSLPAVWLGPIRSRRGPPVAPSRHAVLEWRQLPVVLKVSHSIRRRQRPTHQVVRNETLDLALEDEDLARYTPKRKYDLRSDPSARVYTPAKLLRLLREPASHVRNRA